MGSMTDYLEDALLDHIFKNTTFTSPSTIACALGTVATDGSFTELVNANGYARVSVSPSNWSAAASRAITHSTAILFPISTGSWGTPTVWGIFDSTSYGGGNYLAYGSITSPVEILTNSIPTFSSELISISFDASISNVGWSDSLVHKLLDHTFRNTVYTQPTNIYIGFGITPLTDDGIITGEESASGSGYTRIIHNVWAKESGVDIMSNVGSIDFTVSGNWTPNINAVFISDSLTGIDNSNLMMFGTVSSFSPVAGDTVSVIANDLDITLT